MHAFSYSCVWIPHESVDMTTRSVSIATSRIPYPHQRRVSYQRGLHSFMNRCTRLIEAPFIAGGRTSLAIAISIVLKFSFLGFELLM